MEEKYYALGKLFENADEAQKLLALSPDDAVVYLKEQHGLEFTVDELNDVAAGMRRAFDEADNGELSENDLEAVAGGKNSGAYNAGYYIGKGVKAIGTVIKIIAGVISSGW